MTDYRIVGVNKESEHGHIVEVCTGSGTGHYDHKFSVAEVYQRMSLNDTFHTGSVADGDYASVAKYACHCGRGTLRSHADGKWNNNLDNLAGFS